MKGTCLKCGCTEERACRGGCSWIDEQEDLCNRCALELVKGPIEPATLAEAAILIRTLRAVIFEVGRRAEAFEGLLERALAELAAIPAEPIWTPSDP